MTDDPDTLLSETGRLRREKILALALGAARTRRRNHLAARGLTGALYGILCAALLWAAIWRSPTPPRIAPLVQVPVTTHPSEPDQHPNIVIVPDTPPSIPPPIIFTRIETDPGIAARLAIPAQKPSWQILTDEELLRSLSETGRPAGLVFADGRAALLFRDPARH